MKTIVAAFAVLSVMTGCVREKAPEAKKTYLYCHCADSLAIKPAYGIENRALFPVSRFNPRIRMNDVEPENGVAMIELELTAPAEVSLMPAMAKGEGAGAFSRTFFILPGDSLEFRAVPDPRSKAFVFMVPELVERDRDDNRCRQLLQDSFSKNKPKVVDGDLARYGSEVRDHARKKIAFLDSCRTAIRLSEPYYRMARDEIELDAYNTLCYAIAANPESQVPEGYTDGFEITDLNRGNPIYISGLLNRYVKHAVEDPYGNLEAVRDGIRKAPREKRDYLTALMIGHYAQQQLPCYREQLLALVEEARLQIADTAYLSYINRAEEFYAKCGTSFENEVLDGTWLRTPDSPDRLTLREVLARYEGRPVYIDFWASWCSGCIMDMRQSQQAKEFLDGQGVAYLYVSIDEDAEAWLKSSDENGVAEHSYLCFDEKQSPLIRFMGIGTIPRYLLLDRQHRIVSLDAPRPVAYELQEMKRLVGSI